jgi:hypothetical protein
LTAPRSNSLGLPDISFGMIDFRTPKLIAYLDELTSSRDKAVVLRALSIAFPFLQVRNDWMDRIEELEDAMHLTFEERGDLIVGAAWVADELKEPSLVHGAP